MEAAVETRPVLDAALLGAVVPEKKASPQKDLLRQEEIPQVAHLLLAGHTCRYRMLSDGTRQITAILVPGDICVLKAALHRRANYGVAASSSSPISGIGVLTTMATALLLPLIVGSASADEGRFVTAMALLLAAVVVTTASIANDNLQDLKTGQLVGATPSHQQVALIIGVAIGAAVIAPLLSLL